MEQKDIMKMSKKELLAIENFQPEEDFNAIVIVPTEYMHDSGYRCMKFILCDGHKIVGAVSGWSDVVHINGIGGYGNWRTNKMIDFTKKPKGYGWSIDCLPKSRCLRLFSDRLLELDDFIGSDFQFYVKED